MLTSPFVLPCLGHMLHRRFVIYISTALAHDIIRDAARDMDGRGKAYAAKTVSFPCVCRELPLLRQFGNPVEECRALPIL